MYITAALIGLGAFIIFHDLPRIAQDKAIQYTWIPHIAVFLILFLMHGATAEGTVIAGIAALVFRWLLHRLATKRHADQQAALNPSSPRSIRSARFLLHPEESPILTKLSEEPDTQNEELIALAIITILVVCSAIIIL